ncbi:glycosyltransferase [Sphingomonas colocasiae]|uniref:Glycosyltransferase n=1 Tax=Sphingomonas colocasiae TaxID=1848973 RepID=A0ABS7PP64_9SPHN|nr:glycosyltransferase [Sphingomonas colocasiae]MBY8823041.1 glycosyltransferase [Sphingomonas colocasiae]
MTTASLAQALIRDKFLINFNNLVSNPMRTGIQRVCYEFCSRWPYLDDTIAFVELGMDRIGILDPGFFEHVRELFEENDDILRSLAREFDDLAIDSSPGWIGLLSARNRILCEVSVVEALEACRAVISLEESLNLEFFSLAAATRPEKIFNLCHDFLSWTHSEFFSTDWRTADNVALSLANRRKYTHNIFTSTTTRDVFVNRINRGDNRPYRVIAPGADGLGRTYRKTAPRSLEFLVVGTLEPRKQSLHILRAFERLQAQGHDARLCFAGKMGWLEPDDKLELKAAFERHAWLRWVDSPADDELRDLMMDCRATIYMSVAEGFGSPPVESLALGVPCIVTADLPSILDLASGGQLRVAAHDGDGLEQAVRSLLDDDAILALQAEIETLALPTWQAFVDGLAALIVEKAPPSPDYESSTSYKSRLGILASLTLMRQLDRTELIEHLLGGAIPGIGERDVIRWQIKAERAGWSNGELVLNLLAAYPRMLPARLVNDAVAGTLEVPNYVPTNFAKQWQARFRRLMRIPAFPAFYDAIYTDLLMRAPAPDEVGAHMPYDEREQLRTTYLRTAIGSKEYRERLASGVLHKSPEGYFDAVALPTIGWKLHVLDQLANEAAVERAMLVDDDGEFLEIASLDLTGQLPSRDARARFETVLRSRHGREKVLLRLLLSEACLRRVRDSGSHLDLVHQLATRAKLAAPKRIDVHAIAGKVNAVIALPTRQLLAGFSVFFGRTPKSAELALVDIEQGAPGNGNDARLLAARLLLYGTLRGDIASSSLFVSWSAECLNANRSASLVQRPTDRQFVSPGAAFAEFFGREPEGAEGSVLADAAADGLERELIVDAVRIAAIRAGMISDLAVELDHFARSVSQLTTQFDRLDMLADRLLAAAPEQRGKAWSRPLPLAKDNVSSDSPAASEPGLVARARMPDGEVVTVDQLMAIDGSDFVREAYRKLLLREADEGGLQTYMKALRGGRSKAAVIYSLRTSAEGRAADANLVGLEDLLARQRKMRRWPVRKLLQLVGVSL